MKIGKILIIPLFLFVLLFGSSKLEVHAEEVTEYRYTYQFYMEYPMFENDFNGTINKFENCVVHSNWELIAYYDEKYPGRPNEDHVRIVAVNTDGIQEDFKYKVDGEIISYYPEGHSSKFGDAVHYWHAQAVTAENFMSIADGLENHFVGLNYEMNIPLFESKESANNYIVYNDASGQLNRPNVDITDTSLYDSSYYLIDFQANQSINAIWSGVSQRSNYIDNSVSEYINIHVGYAYNQAPGQIATVEKVPIDYPISDRMLSLLYDDIKHSDDSLHVKYVRFTPMYWSNTNNNGYYGESVYIYFDSSGNVDNLPHNPLDAEYDNSLPVIKNLSYNSLSPRDCHGTFTASGVTCFELSWDIPQSEEKDIIEVHLYSKYGYTTPLTTSEKFKTEMIDISGIGGSIFVNEGTHVFCSKEIGESLNIENMSAFDIHTIYKVYVRVLRLDENTKKYTCGNWSIFNIDKNGSFSLDINQSTVGSGVVVPGDITINDNGTFEGEVIEDIEAVEKDNDNVLLGIDFTNLSTVFTSFASILRGLIGAVGHFPALFNSVFSMLPYELRMGFIILFYVSLIVGLIKIFK